MDQDFQIACDILESHIVKDHSNFYGISPAKVKLFLSSSPGHKDIAERSDRDQWILNLALNSVKHATWTSGQFVILYS